VVTATGPNQVWTWDITLLPGRYRGEFFHLFVSIDLFSRYVVGWMVAAEATAESGQLLISTAMERQQIADGSLILHSDRGPQMKCKSWSALEEALGLTRSFSRPRVSDDNPFVEAHFKTLKYRAGYPGRFSSLEDARGFCQDFFRWYNESHFHSGISYLTPFSVHYGLADAILATRKYAVERGFNANPHRFARVPSIQSVPTLVGINHQSEVTFDPALSQLL
jgi:putative transposase